MMPDVFGLSALPSWYHQTMMPVAWIGRLDWTIWLPPGSCIDYQARLLLRGLGPLLLLALLPIGYGVREAALARQLRQHFSPVSVVLTALPALLFLSFCLCPSVSTSIFSAWGCRPYVVNSDTGAEWFFLREDQSVICSKDGERMAGHAKITGLASLFVLVWPLGMPLCYVLVLLLCRKSILERRQTPLVVATEVLHKEYRPTLFWWEVLPLLQRITLTGFVLLIADRYELLRLLVGLHIALFYLVRACPVPTHPASERALQRMRAADPADPHCCVPQQCDSQIVLLLARPYKQQLVNAIAFGAQISLVSVFLCATLLKVYYWAPAEQAEALTGFSADYKLVVVMLGWRLAELQTGSR